MSVMLKEHADDIMVIGPKTMMGHTNVHEIVNSSLVVDAVYLVLVEFDTLAGNISSTTTFSKQSIVFCKPLGSLKKLCLIYFHNE